MFQCIYVAQFLYFFICRLISRLLPCPSYCKKGCKEYWGICISFRTAKNIGAPASLSGMVSSGYMPSSGIVGSYDSSLPSFFFFFLETRTLISIVILSIYFSTNSAKGFPSPHPLQYLFVIFFF